MKPKIFSLGFMCSGYYNHKGSINCIITRSAIQEIQFIYTKLYKLYSIRINSGTEDIICPISDCSINLKKQIFHSCRKAYKQKCTQLCIGKILYDHLINHSRISCQEINDLLLE